MTRAPAGGAIGGVVLDIEGTTTPVSFVYDVLFPYVRVRLIDYLREHSAELADAVGALRAEWSNDVAEGEPVAVLVPRGAVNGRDASKWALYVEWLMERDRKSPGLKLIQGRMWQGGYDDGTLRGAVYPDVPPAFARWRAAGTTIAIYSSGSVLAQQLLFRHSTAGDLTPFIEYYFDTGVGPKRSADSYRRIASSMHRNPSTLLFVSDVQDELDAARAAGMPTLLCVRGPEDPESDGGHRVIHSFDDISR